jgi:hypothetical protein
MKQYRFSILPCFLAIFIITSCGTKQEQKEPEERKISPRVWMGAAFQTTEEGLEIDQIMRGFAFDDLDTRPGDRLVSIGGDQITNYESLTSVMKSLTSRRNIEVMLMRDTLQLNYNVDMGLLFFKDDDQYQSSHRNKKCDFDCNCTISVNNHDCLLFYNNKGEGDHGGIKFEKNCIW